MYYFVSDYVHYTFIENRTISNISLDSSSGVILPLMVFSRPREEEKTNNYNHLHYFLCIISKIMGHCPATRDLLVTPLDSSTCSELPLSIDLTEEKLMEYYYLKPPRTTLLLSSPVSIYIPRSR
jgi:hypothetical protein